MVPTRKVKKYALRGHLTKRKIKHASAVFQLERPFIAKSPELNCPEEIFVFGLKTALPCSVVRFVRWPQGALGFDYQLHSCLASQPGSYKSAHAFCSTVKEHSMLSHKYIAPIGFNWTMQLGRLVNKFAPRLKVLRFTSWQIESEIPFIWLRSNVRKSKLGKETTSNGKSVNWFEPNHKSSNFVRVLKEPGNEESWFPAMLRL